jgi:hypothetical protein
VGRPLRRHPRRRRRANAGRVAGKDLHHGARSSVILASIRLRSSYRSLRYAKRKPPWPDGAAPAATRTVAGLPKAFNRVVTLVLRTDRTTILTGLYSIDYNPINPAHRGASSGDQPRRSGMRRPAGRLVTGSREAFGRHRPPATTSGTCERTNASRRDTAHVHRPNVGPRRARRP